MFLSRQRFDDASLKTPSETWTGNVQQAFEFPSEKEALIFILQKNVNAHVYHYRGQTSCHLCGALSIYGCDHYEQDHAGLDLEISKVTQKMHLLEQRIAYYNKLYMNSDSVPLNVYHTNEDRLQEWDQLKIKRDDLKQHVTTKKNTI